MSHETISVASNEIERQLNENWFEKEVVMFGLPNDACIKSIQIKAMRKGGGFLPIVEIDPGQLSDDYHHCFKILINGHMLQSKDAPCP